MPHGTAFEHDLPSLDCDDRRVQADFGLGVFGLAGGGIQLVWAKVRPPNWRCWTQRLLARSLLQHQHLSGAAARSPGFVRLLTGFRNVSQSAQRPVQIPLAGLLSASRTLSTR